MMLDCGHILEIQYMKRVMRDNIAWCESNWFAYVCSDNSCVNNVFVAYSITQSETKYFWILSLRHFMQISQWVCILTSLKTWYVTFARVWLWIRLNVTKKNRLFYSSKQQKQHVKWSHMNNDVSVFRIRKHPTTQSIYKHSKTGKYSNYATHFPTAQMR